MPLVISISDSTEHCAGRFRSEVNQRRLKFANPSSGFGRDNLGSSHTVPTVARCDSCKRIEKLVQAESMGHISISSGSNPPKLRLRIIRVTGIPAQEPAVYGIRTLVQFQLFKRRENFAQHALDLPAVFELEFKLLIANTILLSSNQVKILCMLPFGQFQVLSLLPSGKVQVLRLLPLGKIDILRMLPVGDADGCNYGKDGADRLDPTCYGRATKRGNTCDQNTRTERRGNDRGVPDYGTGQAEANSGSHTATPSLLISQGSSFLWVVRNSATQTLPAEIAHG